MDFHLLYIKEAETLTSGQKDLQEEPFKGSLPLFILPPASNSGIMAGDQAASLDHEETLRIEAVR